MSDERATAGGQRPPAGRRLPPGYHALFVAAIVLLPPIVYAPALNRVFTVHDSLWYLAELDGSRSLIDGLALADYNRSCRFERGDSVLFRPLFFAWLAVQNSIAGYDHTIRNIAQLAAHVVVSLLLYRLLYSIQPSPLAGAFALFFAVHPASFGLVTWNQVALLPAFACLLVALAALRELLSSERWRGPSVAAYLVAMTLACFGYELMPGVALIAAVLIAWNKRRGPPGRVVRRTLIALVPPLLFALAYGARAMLFHEELGGRVAAPERHWFRLVGDTGRTLAAWAARFAAFGGINHVPAAYGRTGMGFTFEWIRPEVGLSQLLAVGIAVAAWPGVCRRTIRARGGVLVVAAAAIAGYSLLLNLGRGVHEALTHEHYPYFFCLMATLLCCSLLDWSWLPNSRRRWSVILLSVAIAVAGWATRGHAERMHDENAEADAYLKAIARFVEEHRDEPGFSFRMAAPPGQLDPPVVLIEGRQDDPHAPRIDTRAAKILFAPHYDDGSPRYVLEWRDERLAVRRPPAVR